VTGSRIFIFQWIWFIFMGTLWG